MKAVGQLNGRHSPKWNAAGYGSGGGSSPLYLLEGKRTLSGERELKQEIQTKIIFHLLELKRTSYERTVERCEAVLKELKPEYEKAFGKGSFNRIYADVLGVG